MLERRSRGEEEELNDMRCGGLLGRCACAVAGPRVRARLRTRGFKRAGQWLATERWDAFGFTIHLNMLESYKCAPD